MGDHPMGVESGMGRTRLSKAMMAGHDADFPTRDLPRGWPKRHWRDPAEERRRSAPLNCLSTSAEF